MAWAFFFCLFARSCIGLGKFPRQYDRHEIRCESPAWSRVTSVTSASRDERRPRPQQLRGARAGAEPRSPRSLPTSRLASPPAPAPPRLPPRGAGGSGGEPDSARLCSPCPGDSGAEAEEEKEAPLPTPAPPVLPPRPLSGTEGGVGRGREVPPPRARARLNGRPPRAGRGRGRAGGGRGRDEGAGPERLRTKLYQLPRRAGGTGASSAVTQSESSAHGRAGGAKRLWTNERQEKAGKAEPVLAAGGAGARGGVWVP